MIETGLFIVNNLFHFTEIKYSYIIVDNGECISRYAL